MAHMYHEITYEQQKRSRRRLIVDAVLLAIVVALMVFVFMGAHQNAREQGVISLRESIINSAKQCCAVEGSYPSSLDHLEENYGLVINRDDYVVSYEWFADNVIPSVVVTAR
jgi:hypothetical protein